jgi:hypothetical protein
MKIQNKLRGSRIEPLETVILQGCAQGRVVVRDSLDREYFHCEADGSANVQFTVGGALGMHHLTLEDQTGRVLDSLHFRVESRTRLKESSGQFAELLDLLYYTMASEPMPHYTAYRSRLYFYFVGWLRDHVHTMKGMKYFESKLYDGIELYRDSQREDGMIWDNVHPRHPASTEDNHWGKRFRYGDFERTFVDGTSQFTRIPIENDVEYLFVEGLYYTWKAIGDDEWMASCLDAAMKAYEYSVTSPYRWSKKYGLLKRGHTIDTWDFQNEADCLSDFVGWPDPMAVHPEKTHFGIMFGDNTGYAVGCEYLAEMLEKVGRREEAGKFRQRGTEIRQRLDQISWNGRFFTHHVPEEAGFVRDLGVDEATQVSLSNAYSVNRRISHEQAVAILRTYLGIRENLPPGSPGEWYTIYPPFQKGYGTHNAIWQYMNSSVTPIVAGELAHGAFEHGFETYGVDILHRLLELGRPSRYLHCSYTGAYPPLPERKFTPVSLLPYANVAASLVDSPEAPDWRADEHPNLLAFPQGELNLDGVPFQVLAGPKGALGISRQEGYLQEVEIPLNEKTRAFYFLHTLARIQSGVGGTILIRYADGSTYSKYVIAGENALIISHWGYQDIQYDKHDKRRTSVVWRANHPQHLNQQMVAYGLDNPHPEKEIRSLTLKAAEDGTMWFVLGLTLSDSEVYFPPDPISFGIPDQWGAAACVYALVEGLAGVVDGDTAFRKVNFAPRWLAAGVDRAEATIHYPASDGYVAYRYSHDAENSLINIELTGSGEACACHILLPEGASKGKRVTADGEAVVFTQNSVEGSKYVDFHLSLNGVRRIKIEYI